MAEHTVANRVVEEQLKKLGLGLPSSTTFGSPLRPSRASENKKPLDPKEELLRRLQLHYSNVKPEFVSLVHPNAQPGKKRKLLLPGTNGRKPSAETRKNVISIVALPWGARHIFWAVDQADSCTILVFRGQWRAWRGVDRGFAKHAFAYSRTKPAQDRDFLPSVVSKGALALEDDVSISDRMLTSRPAQPTDEHHDAQDHGLTIDLTDEPTSKEITRFDRWVDKLHDHFGSQQPQFIQRKYGFIVNQAVEVFRSTLSSSSNPDIREQGKSYACVQLWSRKMIFWTLDLDGKRSIVVPFLDDDRTAFVQWEGIEEGFKDEAIAFTSNKAVRYGAREDRPTQILRINQQNLEIYREMLRDVSDGNDDEGGSSNVPLEDGKLPYPVKWVKS
ncbi:MAG: hypothetical protein Q9202_004282 [Teloschistes flavicans]